MDLAAGPAARELQLPVWNALYQIRDFSQYLNWIKAQSPAGQSLPVTALDKSRWRITGAENGAAIDYEIYADQSGPYGAQLNSHHAFFNLAEILMYPVDARSSPIAIRFTSVPSGWNIATSLAPDPSGGFSAENYDRLVDSPVEIGAFQEADFDQAGAHYRIVVDAEPADYDMQKLVSMDRRIAAAATSWMNDRPYDTYLFIYHFPRQFGFGGMEHAYSTAIDLSAQQLADSPQELAEVSAHEFFHLWNVKRIRPQSLEPIDYTKENYTTALWFSEGVTSSVEGFLLLRAGLLDEAGYLKNLEGEISALEHRPAHLTQSAERSSLDAWLEKYPYYRRSDRSISYYNKGELLGVLLDLELREASHGAASLRELFQWLNQNYARQGRFFPDSDGVRQAAEAITHVPFSSFFEKWVAGTGEVPWNDFFRTVGLRLVERRATVADAGFSVGRSSDNLPVVNQVTRNSDAEKAGLQVDGVIVEFDGREPPPQWDQAMRALEPGEAIRLRVRQLNQEKDLQWKLASREEVEFELKDVDNITARQKARRAAWLKGEAQGDAQP